MNGKIVGRISGIIQHLSNKKHNERKLRFTRFDSIDNQDVANKLFDAIVEYAKENDLNEIVGPLGFSDLEREGLLIEGFDELATFEEQYNYSYYQTLIENYGFVKDVDWVERQVRIDKSKGEKLRKISEGSMKKYNLHFGKAKNTKEFIKKYGDQIFDVLDITYEKLYGTVPLTAKTKQMIIDNFTLVINLNNVAVILDENDRVISFGICIPSIAKAIQKSQGHLTLPALIKVLKAVKNPKIIDLALVGVLPEYQKTGVIASLIYEMYKMLERVDYAETNLNLEDNISIISMWNYFDARLHKRRRCFIKKL